MAWACVGDTFRGSMLVPDGGFDCLKKGDPVEVIEDNGRLLVICDIGRHYLDGQLNEFDEYVGFKHRHEPESVAAAVSQ